MSYHSKNGKFTTKAAAHTVSKGGERFKVVRQYRRIKGGGEQVATHQRKTQSHEKVVEAIELAKARTAAVRGLLGRDHVPVVEAIEALSEKETKFDKLVKKLAAKGADDPKALAAYIGRKKLGKEAFQAKAAAGRKKAMGEATDQVMLLKDAVGRMIGVYDSDHQALLAKELMRYELNTGKTASVSVKRGAEGRRIVQQADSLKPSRLNRDTQKE